jgi:hypothetical protein
LEGVTLVSVLTVLGAVAAALWAFGTEVAKLRIEADGEATQQLLTKRFAAYADLWHRTAPTAIYSNKDFGPADAARLRESLSAWYFSKDGGIFLTARTRDLYFALQDILSVAAGLRTWKCSDRPEDPKQVFLELLERLDERDRTLAEQILRETPDAAGAERWREIVKALAAQFSSLPINKRAAGDYVYAAIQQVASVLRTGLTFELGSRLNVNRSLWPFSLQRNQDSDLTPESASVCHPTADGTPSLSA